MMADAAAFPVSYKDPQYAALDAATEQKLGLPGGLLSSVRLNGEKSNADQVSDAGAKTPYQIIPATRQAAIKDYGIDPYLSAQNASEVAGRLLADSLKRNQGDPQRAVAEYIGGTDPSNWGPKTKAYVARVTGALAPAQAPGAPQPSVAGMTGPSTFDRVFAQTQAAQAPNQIAAIYQAYQSGQMSPQEQQDFESDVRSGKMMLPRGAALKTGSPGVGGAVPGAGAPGIPDGVMRAFARGDMTPQEMGDFEHDVRSGALKLPPGMDADTLFGAPEAPKGVLDRLAAVPGQLREAITGADRRTATSDALPDWGSMPELNQITTLAGWKTGAGTLFANPDEAVQVIKANYPGVQVARDESGNYLLTSSIDGKQYAIKPGFQVSDIPRAGASIAAFTPAGRATSIAGAALRAGAAQSLIEGSQAATGGSFDPGEVLTAAAGGAAVPAAGRVLSVAAGPARALVGKLLGHEAPALDAAAVDPVAAVPAVPAAAPVATTVPQVAATARDAAGGSKQATQDLAGIAAPSGKTVSAAERLGIQDYLQPDHVTTNDAFRQVVGVLKSNPTSQLALGEKQALEKVAARASDVVDEAGGTTDLSQLDASLKARMQAAHAAAGAQEDALWTKLRQAVPAGTEAPAPSALAFLEQRAADLGGAQNLTPMEKMISAKLATKAGGDADMLAALSPAARAQAIEQGAQGVKQPTFALLDDVRKDVGAAARQAGPFSDADTGLAKKYYSLLSGDQDSVSTAAGAGDLLKTAKAATAVRKGMEDDLTSLFGKQLDASVVPSLGGAMRSASAGDATKLLGLLGATPNSMRQEVVASGLQTVFRNAATRGEINFTGYAKWYEGLLRNKQAYHAVMSNLPGPARKQLSDLYRVSKGISDSLSARIKTGLRSSVLEEMKAPDTLASRLYGLAKTAAKGVAMEAGTSAVGMHGAGLFSALMSAMRSGAKPSAEKAVDELLASPEFQRLASAGPKPEAVRSFAYSKPFTRFARAVGNPRELSNREKWVMQALQAANSSGASDVRH